MNIMRTCEYKQEHIRREYETRVRPFRQTLDPVAIYFIQLAAELRWKLRVQPTCRPRNSINTLFGDEFTKNKMLFIGDDKMLVALLCDVM